MSGTSRGARIESRCPLPMNDPCADTPFVWTAGRGGFKRLVAHVLIRLLILMPLWRREAAPTAPT